MELWQRFTSRARRAVLMAHDEAQRAHSNLIGDEHLLWGLLHLETSTAGTLLQELGVDLEALAAEVRTLTATPPTAAQTDEVSFTPAAQRALTRAYREAKELGNYHLGTEHLLLGLLQEDRETVSALLQRHGATLAAVREAVRTRG